MAAVKTKLGRIPCDCCGHPVVLKENEHKTLTVGCDECDVSSFAKNGTAAAARWRAKLPPKAVLEPVADSAPRSVPKGTAPAPVADSAPRSMPKVAAQAPAAEPVPVPVPKKAGPFDPMAFFGKKESA